jgi:hypothetical protein
MKTLRDDRRLPRNAYDQTVPLLEREGPLAISRACLMGPCRGGRSRLRHHAGSNRHSSSAFTPGRYAGSSMIVGLNAANGVAG